MERLKNICLLLIAMLTLSSQDGIAQNYFNRIIEFDDAVPLPNELIQITTDSFVINAKTILNLKDSNMIIEYDAQSDEYIRYDLEGISPNRRSLLKIKDHYYLYATNKNNENDSLTLIKLNEQFDIIEQNNFSSPETLIHQARVLEINNSIYGASAYDPSGDPTRFTHFKKIDTTGNVIWTENYFDDLRAKGDSDYSVTPDHHILSANVIRFDIFDTFPQVVKTDTLGNVIWRYDHFEETGSTSSPIVNLSNGNIIFGQAIDLSINELIIKWIWLDANGNYLKEKLQLPYEQFETYGISNFIEGRGDYFFGHGFYRENAPDSSSQESFGLITKFDNDGEEIWSHRYKHPDYNLNGDLYSLIDMIEEENGDLVVLGQISRFSDPSPFKVWLFRLDPTGCPDPAYCDEFINFTNTEETTPSFKNVKIYPNPSSSFIYIDLPKSHSSGLLEIINSYGQVVKKELTTDAEQHQIKVSDFPNGTYYVKFHDPKEAVIYRSSFLVID